MMPKNLMKSLSVAVFVCITLMAAAQTKKSKSSQPKIKPPTAITETLSGRGPIITIIERGDEGIPLAFLWQLNADTVLKKGDVFREMISFPGTAVLNRFMADDTTALKRSTDKEYKVTSRFVSFSGENTSFSMTEDKGMLILESPETHLKKQFKVVLDKARKNIVKLQDVETGHIYLPAPFEGGSVSG
ncbi:hypothetical protein PV783_24645 [Chitinophaga sp. CC14]|uniref:hypothetical protein n=1 Tax=Chitinophaga sp. CC14 TaxID=3029199 RepID=UPI003B78BE9C